MAQKVGDPVLQMLRLEEGSCVQDVVGLKRR